MDELEDFTKSKREIPNIYGMEGEHKLSVNDADHIAGDIKRAYNLLVYQWLDYMHYLKNNYPYLFSLAMRLNPFDEKATPEVR